MESITFGIYEFLLLLCVLQCFALAGIFLFREKFKKKSNIAIALCLIGVGLQGIEQVNYHSGFMALYPSLRYLPTFFEFLMPIGLYYCATYILNPNFRFKQIDYWFMAPLFLISAIQLIIYLSYIYEPQIIENNKTAYTVFRQIANIITMTYTIGIITNICLKINKYHRQLFNNHSEIEGKNLSWLRNLYLAVAVVFFLWAYVQYYFILYKEDIWIFRLMWILIFGLLYFMGFFLILRGHLFEIPTFKSEDENDSKKPILSDKTDEHYQKLLQLMQDQKLYHDAELSMDTLAEKTELSNGYLSRIINQKEGKNFYDFINSYRITEVKNNLTNPDYAHYSILGIGLEAGFKSKSTFNAVFKKMTGMTPSAYKKTLN